MNLERRAAGVILVVALALGTARIVTTYNVLSQTVDEPSHVGGGLEWLQYGSSWFEPKHPPLARVFGALGPYLDGARLEQPATGHRIHMGLVSKYGAEALEKGGRYDRRLRLARMGILPFFLIGGIAVWLLTRHLFGPAAALGAVIAASNSPIFLAHSGLVTNDAALTATMTLAVFVLIAFLARPSPVLAAGAGAAMAFSLLSKMSAVVFLPLSGVVVVGLATLSRWRTASAPRTGHPVLVLLALGSMAFVLWAGFQFSVGSLVEIDPRFPERAAQALGSPSRLLDPLLALARLQIIPAPEWFAGVKDLLASNRDGTKGYLVGMVYQGGHPLYFPVGIAVKTPLALLVLQGAGIGLAVAAARRTGNWVLLAPAAASAAILAVVIPSQINIGVRHVLPVFLLLIPYAGLAAAWLLGRTSGHAGRILGVGLAVWFFWSTTRIHPDYLAYFNELALLSREPVLVNSDLDWGQDGKRLISTARALNIDSLHVGYFGTADLQRRGLSAFDTLADYRPVTGWVAISINRLTLGRALEPASDQFAWIRSHRPERMIGRSILLYRIPPG